MICVCVRNAQEGYVPGAVGARRNNAVNNKEPASAAGHSNQSKGMSPGVIALLVLIVAAVGYGVMQSL